MSVLTITTRTDRQASGVAGVTRRRSHAGEHGRPFKMPIVATGRYKETKFSSGLVRESELPIVPFASRRQHNFGRGKGQCLHRVSKEGKE